MNEAAEQIFLSDNILGFMRHAAELAVKMREPFITIRTLLLAMLDDAALGPALEDVLPREKLEQYEQPDGDATKLIASRVAEPQMGAGERAAMLRFNTLAFKLPDGSKSVWLSREAFTAWTEAARRVGEGERFMPKHIAFGIAADAVRAPGILTQLRVSPSDVNEAILKL